MDQFEFGFVGEQVTVKSLVTMAADTSKIRNRAVVEFLTLQGRTP